MEALQSFVMANYELLLTETAKLHQVELNLAKQEDTERVTPYDFKYFKD